MVHKIALLVGGIGAAVVLAVALVVGGFVPAGPVSADGAIGGLNTESADPNASPSTSASPGATDDGNGGTRKVIDTIFVLPSPDATNDPGRGDDSGRDSDDENGRDRDRSGPDSGSSNNDLSAPAPTFDDDGRHGRDDDDDHDRDDDDDRDDD